MIYPEIINLDGTWEFFYSPVKFDLHPESLPAPEQFTGKMVTPGYWDDHYELFDQEDFFGLTARFNPDYRKPHFPMGRLLMPHACSSFLIGSGFYRRLIRPELESGTHSVLTVGPAMWGVSVFCNRQLVGYFSGYSTATDFDLTPFLRSGVDNELIVVVENVHDDGGAFARVDGSHAGIPFGARPGQHRGLAAQGYQSERAGINCGVSLKLTRQARIADWFVTYEQNQLHWHVETVAGQGKTLRYKILDDAEILAQGTVALPADNWDFQAGNVPQLWSDREPKLYTLQLDLVDDAGGICDTVAQKWGARQVAVRGTQIFINGVATYFRGATEHCYFPETCNPHCDKAKYLRDLGQLKKCGFNFIRCHTWCPPEEFYVACDELGILVQTEQPSVYTLEESTAIFRQIRRHPAAVIFCEGNEKIVDARAMPRFYKLVELLRRMIPGMLFNPQEAIRGVEYEFKPEQHITDEPFPHDAERLAELAQISDVYGCLSQGFFSYFHDEFPGVKQMEYLLSIYHKPCLSHEIGILGGYLDFELEPRYRGTFIGTDLFEAAREHMQKHHVYEFARKYYEANCIFIASLRKQLMENLRSCPSLTGYDFLGGIDTHWHLTGYPCGVLNEFYEEKFGETCADVRRYNAATVLLCSALNQRNFYADQPLECTLKISHFGATPLTDAQLMWRIVAAGKVVAHGEKQLDSIPCGALIDLAELSVNWPPLAHAEQVTLQVELSSDGKIFENHWDFYVFPQVSAPAAPRVRQVEYLTLSDLEFMAQGGRVLLTDHFPGTMEKENFRPTTSGRSEGHSGALLHSHPIWAQFPQNGLADWQFFPLMRESHSLVWDETMPKYQAIMELIPPFKLVERKSPLAEFQVGAGRLMICGLRVERQEPAAQYLKALLLNYLAGDHLAPAPLWNSADLKKRLELSSGVARAEKAVDAGGRPAEWGKN